MKLSPPLFRDERDSFEGSCCSICGRRIHGTKWFCTSCWGDYGDRPREAWIKFLVASEKKRRRDLARDIVRTDYLDDEYDGYGR